MKDAIQQAQEKGRPLARQPSGREAFLEAISKEEALLARLDHEQADARARLAALHAELSSLGTEPEIRVRLPIVTGEPIPRTSAEKVRLFRSLFRGREDVFPTRFVAKKTGKPGYTPAFGCVDTAR